MTAHLPSLGVCNLGHSGYLVDGVRDTVDSQRHLVVYRGRVRHPPARAQDNVLLTLEGLVDTPDAGPATIVVL